MHEKFAAFLAVLFLPIYFTILWFLPDGKGSSGEATITALLWLAIWGVLLLVCVIAAIAMLFVAPADRATPSRKIVSRILPLVALFVALGLNLMISDWRSDERKLAFAAQSKDELSGKPPKAVIYSKGIPDGGYAIVRSPGKNPEGFTQKAMVELTGERISDCERLDERDWYCHFD